MRFPAKAAALDRAETMTGGAAGADSVIDSVADLWPVLETIAARIAAGERPSP